MGLFSKRGPAELVVYTWIMTWTWDRTRHMQVFNSERAANESALAVYRYCGEMPHVFQFSYRIGDAA